MKLFPLIIAAASLLGAGTPSERFAPVNWNRETVTGYVSCDEEFQLFGEGNHKELYLVQRYEGWGWYKPLEFASVEDYKLAERNIGLVVKATLIETRQGHTKRFLVERLAVSK